MSFEFLIMEQSSVIARLEKKKREKEENKEAEKKRWWKWKEKK